MNTLTLPMWALLCAPVLAQSPTIFPSDYTAVPEGPFNSPNLPLARGTSRVQCLYDAADLQIPSGNSITRIGFREDTTTTSTDVGRALQLEVRMGWSNEDHQTMGTNFDNNYATTPVTVFGPALFTLPDLRDASAPLANGQFFVDLASPFAYTPNGRNLVVEYRIFGTSGGGSQFTYRLDRADYYSTVSYGPAGCQHASGGPPNLTVQPTRPGLSFATSVNSGPTNAPAFLAVALGSGVAQPYSLAPIFPGISSACQGQLDPLGIAVLSGSTGNSGAESWSFPIPNLPQFSKFDISSQAIFLDFFSPGTVVVSNAGSVLTGLRPRTTIIAANGVPTTVTSGSRSLHYAPVAFFEHQ
ncbi:MAG: hypothetical protein AB8H80_01865 [Planctomycetota bacterium]